jgi:hypothetical protein
MAMVTGKTVVSGMPVLAFMGHLTLINPDSFPAGITVFSKHTIKTS